MKKTITINERAMAQALDFVMGAEARMALENLYTILDAAADASFAEGVMTGDGIGYSRGYKQGFNNGYDEGLDVSTTSCEQPDSTAYDAEALAGLPPMQEQVRREPGETQYRRQEDELKLQGHPGGDKYQTGF